MKQPDTNNDDVVFLGINFNNFFRSCGCVKREEPEEENNDNAILINKRKAKHPDPNRLTTPVKPVFDTQSIASSTDWSDIEEIPLPTNNIFSGEIGSNQQDSNIMDDFLTQEPIDFETLRKITEDDKEANDEDKSSQSGLSKSSKKISKGANAKLDKKNRSKSQQKNTEAKGKRKPWQPYEDAKVLELVAKYGQSWAVVASLMEGRTGKQIRDRYLNKLKANIRRTDWTPEEDRLLLTLYYQLGHKWSRIATYLPGRTEGQVKNRFYSHIKKKLTGHEGSEQYSGTVESPESNFSGTNTLGGNSKMEPKDYYNQVGSPDSTRTATTQESRISNDKEVNVMLDKLTGYLGTNGNLLDQNLRHMPVENNQHGYGGNAQDDRFGQLQDRKNKLELLLSQTLQEMGTMNYGNEAHHQGNYQNWG